MTAFGRAMAVDNPHSEDCVALEVKDGVAQLILDRADRGNALDLPMARRLLRCAIRCDQDSSVRVVTLSAAGRLFCAGGDIEGFAAAGADAPSYLSELAGTLHLALSRLVRMRKPLVARVHGAAAGAGVPLAAIGDVVIAADSAHFTCAYTAIGLTADGASTWILPRLVGLRRAQEMLLTNRRIDAAEAAAIGLITRAVPQADLDSAIAETVQRFAAGPTAALGGVKALLAQSFTNGFETQMELEARAIAEAGGGPEAAEGIRAFLAKRPADFRRAP